MAREVILKQAREDAERIEKLTPAIKERLSRKTDWAGYRLRAYEFPSQKAGAAS